MEIETDCLNIEPKKETEEYSLALTALGKNTIETKENQKMCQIKEINKAMRKFRLINI